ncbi:hypothetical protein GCM10028801_38590 [Nocardioides maradonensis]
MLSSLAPLWIFMLLPVWIPLLGVVFGVVADRVASLRGKVAEPSIHEKIHLRRQREAGLVAQAG